MAGVSSKLFNKRTAVLLGGAAVIAIAAAWAFWLSAPSGPGPQVSASSAPEGYILDKTFDLSLEDIKKSRGAARPGEFNTGTAQADAAGYTTGSGEAGARDYMTENLGVSVFTRKYFKYLEKQFKHSPDLETHLAEVRDYLFSQLPEDEALEFFNLYKKYLDCEMELAQLLPSWGRPADLEGQLALLARVQEFRRDALGRDAADALFGADVKTKEYALRRGAMVSDPDLYGAEKEERIRVLNEDMWGEQAQAVEDHPLPYNRYRERLQMYDRDFSEMDSREEKDAMVREFREEFFDSEAVARLEEVDAMMEARDAAQAAYDQAAQGIMEDESLSPAERERAVQDLAREVFGDGAEAQFRREAIEQGRESFMQRQGRGAP